MEDYYESDRKNQRRSLSRDGRGVYVGNEKNRRDGWRGNHRERSVSRGRSVSMNGRYKGMYDNNNGRNSPQGRKCFRCGRPGHMVSECRWALGSCLGCGKKDHRINECPNARQIKCFECGGKGHKASECSSGMKNKNRCGNCGKNGHYARMCQSPRSKCTKCGMEGHVADVCRRNERANSGSNNQGNEV